MKKMKIFNEKRENQQIRIIDHIPNKNKKKIEQYPISRIWIRKNKSNTPYPEYE